MTTGPADTGRGSRHYLNVLQEKPKAHLRLQFPTSHQTWEPIFKGWAMASLPLCDYYAVRAAPLRVDAVNLGSRVRPKEPALQTGSSRCKAQPPGLATSSWLPRPGIIWSWNTQATEQNKDQLPRSAPPWELELSPKPQNPSLIHG